MSTKLNRIKVNFYVCNFYCKPFDEENETIIVFSKTSGLWHTDQIISKL